MHIVPHCTPCTYCTHGIHCCHTITRHLVSLTIFWQKGQWVLRCCTSHKNLQILQNSTLQVPCTKAALCLCQQLFNTLACQEAALHFNHTLPMLFVLYSFHFMYIIVLCTSDVCVPIHAHIGPEKGWVVPSGKTIVLPGLTCPRLVLGATQLSALPTALEAHHRHCILIHLCKTGRYFWFISRVM